jgi:hypothetical protein
MQGAQGLQWANISMYNAQHSTTFKQTETEKIN